MICEVGESIAMSRRAAGGVEVEGERITRPHYSCSTGVLITVKVREEEVGEEGVRTTTPNYNSTHNVTVRCWVLTYSRRSHSQTVRWWWQVGCLLHSDTGKSQHLPPPLFLWLVLFCYWQISL